jgi:Fe-S cluster biogenesis protein NfuA
MCEQCGCGSTDSKKTFEEKVKDAIAFVQPMLQNHGGDIELVGVDKDKNVKVRLQGACACCPSAQITLKRGVEQILKEKVPEVKNVIAVD